MRKRKSTLAKAVKDTQSKAVIKGLTLEAVSSRLYSAHPEMYELNVYSKTTKLSINMRIKKKKKYVLMTKESTDTLVFFCGLTLVLLFALIKTKMVRASYRRESVRHFNSY